MMEREPIRNLEIETVFLEVSHRDAQRRFPVLFMLLPRRSPSSRDRTLRTGEDN
jgi:hypothetical protein